MLFKMITHKRGIVTYEYLHLVLTSYALNCVICHHIRPKFGLNLQKGYLTLIMLIKKEQNVCLIVEIVH